MGFVMFAKLSNSLTTGYVTQLYWHILTNAHSCCGFHLPMASTSSLTCDSCSLSE